MTPLREAPLPPGREREQRIVWVGHIRSLGGARAFARDAIRRWPLPPEGDIPPLPFSMTRAPPTIRRTRSPEPFRSSLSARSGVYVPFNEGEVLPRVSAAL